MEPAPADAHAAALHADSERALRSWLDESPRVVRIHALRYRQHEVTIDLGLAMHLESWASSIRQVEHLHLDIVPVVEAYRELGNGKAVLVTRYPAAAGERLLGVSECDGPFRNTAKERFAEAYTRLVDAGFEHLYAHVTTHWLVAVPSGRLMLDQNEALRPLNGKTAATLGGLRRQLDQIPWRRMSTRWASSLAELAESAAAPEAWGPALERAGYPLEAELLAAWTAKPQGTRVSDGPWASHRAYCADRPPVEAAMGDLWFDPLEIGAMVRIHRGWLALRPLACWQARHVTARPANQGRPAPCLPRDISDLSSIDPLTGLTATEAAQMTSSLNKDLPTLQDWQAAAASLSSRQLDELWLGSRREWTATSAPAASAVFVTPRSVNWTAADFDVHVHLDLERPLADRRVTLPISARAPRVGVRTFLPAEKP